MTLKDLQPYPVWQYFEEICQIPRPSKKEERISAFLLEFAKKHRLEAKQDEVGNVLIKKKATAGMENLPLVVLQSHIDMVCEKNADTVHDFAQDPIRPIVDGEWVRAEGTTLGADDGIGMAAQLAILASDTICHGALECLFTVDEETGLTGAFALQPDFLEGNILLNLDSEDEGEMFIGCAGGMDTVAAIPIKYTTTCSVATSAATSIKASVLPTVTLFAAKVSVKGLLGGHSGDDINKGRGNAIKILTRFLWELNNKYGIYLSAIDGGNLRNAIPREANVVFVLPSDCKEKLMADFNVYGAEMENVWRLTEGRLVLELESVDMPEKRLDAQTTTNLLNALYACPHGVFAMSYRMPGMVETSTNLASVKMQSVHSTDNDGTQIIITTSQRSDIDSEKKNIANMVASVFRLVNAQVTHNGGYPGWAPNPHSSILKVALSTYKKLFGKEPLIRSIHAGLECGLFLEKYPNMDMLSFGPTLKGVHSPDERVNIKSVEMWWTHLLEILKTIK
ncbi:aminoacyl-histidine dipeptidase [Bacteroidia bacterium]|nr:aminoacyl-histidine dipeptidase [Bacteroidia bacterium]